MNPTDQLIADGEAYLAEWDSHVTHRQARELLSRLVARALELESWKTQQIAVEAEWDVQAVGRLLNVPLGWPIRASIQPSIEALQARVRELEAERAGLRQNILDWVDHTADGVPVPSCEKLYCPKCKGEVVVGTNLACCNDCSNPDDGDWPNRPPLPLFIESCLSSPTAGPIQPPKEGTR